MPLQKNIDYKMRFRPLPPSYYGRYSVPLPMIGNPPEAKDTRDWSVRADMVYDRMIAEKRKGLWFWSAP